MKAILSSIVSSLGALFSVPDLPRPTHPGFSFAMDLKTALVIAEQGPAYLKSQLGSEHYRTMLEGLSEEERNAFTSFNGSQKDLTMSRFLDISLEAFSRAEVVARQLHDRDNGQMPHVLASCTRHFLQKLPPKENVA